jgi:transcriptional regulator with GAF, ATPase, and Fis domain
MSQPSGGRERLVSRAFVALADTLVDEYDIIDLLDHLVAYSVELLAADAAGILLADARGALHAVASSSEDAEMMELLQLQAEQGPCVDCFRSAAPVSVADLNQAADRWPRFVAAAAHQASFASVHALPLRLRGQAIGALNLLHRTPASLPEDDLALGQALADIATIGILQERAIRRGEVVNEQLQAALTSRVVIEQAKGVLAQHLGLSMDQAFNRLRGYVRGHNLRLADVARLIATRQLDPHQLTTRTPQTHRTKHPTPMSAATPRPRPIP